MDKTIDSNKIIILLVNNNNIFWIFQEELQYIWLYYRAKSKKVIETDRAKLIVSIKMIIKMHFKLLSVIKIKNYKIVKQNYHQNKFIVTKIMENYKIITRKS